MKRLAIFLRSVIPADPSQLIFLAGVVLLFVSSRLSWWPVKLLQTPDFMGSSAPGESGLLALRRLITLCVFPVLFGGLAGYFLCFWPSRTPAPRIGLAVYLPSVVGFSLVVWKTFDVFNQPTSILYRRRMSAGVSSWFHLNMLHFPTGPLICGGGLGHYA